MDISHSRLKVSQCLVSSTAFRAARPFRRELDGITPCPAVEATEVHAYLLYIHVVLVCRMYAKAFAFLEELNHWVQICGVPRPKLNPF